jgi:hypothetical protein
MKMEMRKEAGICCLKAFHCLTPLYVSLGRSIIDYVGPVSLLLLRAAGGNHTIFSHKAILGWRLQ